MEKRVDIIMLTCNQKEMVKKCLSSLKQNTDYKNYAVHLADDSGTNYLGNEIKRLFPWVKFNPNLEHMGYSKTLNIAIKRVIKEYSPDYLLLLNDDMEFIQKDWLTKMVKALESEEKVGIVSCKLVYPEGYLQWFFKDGKMNFIKTREEAKNIEETKDTFYTVEVDNVIGACVLMKKRVIDEIGYYDEGFSPLYGEDTDFCLRAGKKGFKLLYVGDTKIVHYNGGFFDKKEIVFNENKWHLQKSHGIRLEWLNFSVGKIIKLTVIHFGSAIFSKHIFKNLKLLFRAYKDNFNNLKEIRSKRRERNTWTRLY